jgi:hypothetical protein
MSTQPTVVRVIAIDPGITSGYAQGRIEDGLMLVSSGQLEYSPYQLYLALKLADPTHVVCESFEFRRHARDNLNLFSCELIGVVKMFVEEWTIPFKPQTASQAKGHFNDDHLKKAHLYKPAKPHANDAVRHLLYWFQFGPGFQFNTRGYESGI